MNSRVAQNTVGDQQAYERPRVARARAGMDVISGGLANRLCHLANLIQRNDKRQIIWTKSECPVPFNQLFTEDFGLEIIETDEVFERKASVVTCAPQRSLFQVGGEAASCLMRVLEALAPPSCYPCAKVAVHGRFLCSRITPAQIKDFADAINAFIRARDIDEIFVLSDAHREKLKGLLKVKVIDPQCGEMSHDEDRTREEVLRFASDLKHLCQAQFVLSNNGASSVLHLTGAAGATNYVFGPVKEMKPSMLDIRGIKPLFMPQSSRQTRDDLAIVTCHFNFGNFDTGRRNLLRFVRQMERDGVRVYGVEAHFEDERPLTAHLPGWRQIALTSRQALWHKETLLNIAVNELVPSHIDNLIFMDADLWYDTPGWAEKVVGGLKLQPVVQPFETAVWTGRDGHEVRHKSSSAVAGLHDWAGHCGFAWAMRRDVFNNIGGLFDLGVLGGGDHMLAFACLYENPMEEMLKLEILSTVTLDMGGSAKQLYADWAAKVYSWTSGELGWINANLYHEWHGDLIHRQYHDRGRILSGLQLERDLERLPNGTWSWSPYCDPNRMTAVRNYFLNRQENG